MKTVLRSRTLDVALIEYLSRAYVVTVREDADGWIIYELFKP
jgi:hypothetical protein